MIYFVLPSFFIHLNYVYSMEENQEDTVKKLISFITFQDPDNYNYLKWSYQPLAENFKQHNAWSANIVPNLLSTTTYQKANENCLQLLNTIRNNKNQLYEKQIRADRHRDIYICLPLIALLFQLYLNSYEPFGSLCIMEITRHCNTNANVLEDVSQAFSRHRQQLILIESEISTIVDKSNNSIQRQNLITQLLQNNKKEKEFRTNLINLLEQKPFICKKND